MSVCLSVCLSPLLLLFFSSSSSLFNIKYGYILWTSFGFFRRINKEKIYRKEENKILCCVRFYTYYVRVLWGDSLLTKLGKVARLWGFEVRCQGGDFLVGSFNSVTCLLRPWPSGSVCWLLELALLGQACRSSLNKHFSNA